MFIANESITPLGLKSRIYCFLDNTRVPFSAGMTCLAEQSSDGRTSVLFCTASFLQCSVKITLLQDAAQKKPKHCNFYTAKTVFQAV